MPEIQFKGDFHHIEISPDSQLDIGQDVIFQSFTSLNVASGAQLKLGTRVFFNDHCTVRCQHSIEIGKDTSLAMGSAFLTIIISILIITLRRLILLLRQSRLELTAGLGPIL